MRKPVLKFAPPVEDSNQWSRFAALDSNRVRSLASLGQIRNRFLLRFGQVRNRRPAVHSLARLVAHHVSDSLHLPQAALVSARPASLPFAWLVAHYASGSLHPPLAALASGASIVANGPSWALRSFRLRKPVLKFAPPALKTGFPPSMFHIDGSTDSSP